MIMLENYLLIHKDILPDYYEKVLAVRRMLENGKENPGILSVLFLFSSFCLFFGGIEGKGGCGSG